MWLFDFLFGWLLGRGVGRARSGKRRPRDGVETLQRPEEWD